MFSANLSTRDCDRRVNVVLSAELALGRGRKLARHAGDGLLLIALQPVAERMSGGWTVSCCRRRSLS